MATCEHIERVATADRDPVQPSSHGCEECLASGSGWVHLRLCLDCGHVGCCDSSPNRHATAHYLQTQHPVIKSFEPNERWAWCYPDELPVASIPALPHETPPRHIDPP
jgi:uncharacterized UBP type Zn finger protein